MPAVDSSAYEPEPTALAIGREVRATRLSLGLSMRELAARIGTSQPFVSNIENGRIFPSLRTLAIIADALAVPPERLLPPRERVERAGAGAGMRPRRAAEPAARRLVGGADTALTAYRIELRDGEAEPRPFAHDGEDLVYVLAGSIALLSEGVPARTLREGESLRVDGRVPHRLAGGPGGGTALLAVADGAQHAEGAQDA